MSIACLLNAWRCGRMHCYFTGVFFLLGAVATPAYRFGFLPLGTDGWDLLGYSILIGGITLRYLPEWLWGSYAILTLRSTSSALLAVGAASKSSLALSALSPNRVPTMALAPATPRVT